MRNPAQKGRLRLIMPVSLLMLLIWFEQKHYHQAKEIGRGSRVISNNLIIDLPENLQHRKHQRWLARHLKTTSALSQAAGGSHHFHDLLTSSGNNNMLIGQHQPQRHHSIGIGRDSDMFSFASKLQDTNDEYRYNYWTTRHRRHHHGKGNAATTGKKGKGTEISDFHCNGEFGKYQSKSKHVGKGGKGKDARKSMNKHKNGKGKEKQYLKGKGGYSKGKGASEGKGKGGKEGKEGKEGKGGKGGKGSGNGVEKYFDDDGYMNAGCVGNGIRSPSSLQNITPIIVPSPVLVSVPIPATRASIAPTLMNMMMTDTPISVQTTAPSISSNTMSTTDPTPERGLVSVRVSDWYIAFRAPDATVRAPTREEYELILESTRTYVEMYFQNYFMANMLNDVVYVRTDSMLGNAAYGLDVPSYVPQPMYHNHQ
jgi:hypothetical protein